VFGGGFGVLALASLSAGAADAFSDLRDEAALYGFAVEGVRAAEFDRLVDAV